MAQSKPGDVCGYWYFGSSLRMLGCILQCDSLRPGDVCGYWYLGSSLKMPSCIILLPGFRGDVLANGALVVLSGWNVATCSGPGGAALVPHFPYPCVSGTALLFAIMRGATFANISLISCLSWHAVSRTRLEPTLEQMEKYNTAPVRWPHYSDRKQGGALVYRYPKVETILGLYSPLPLPQKL